MSTRPAPQFGHVSASMNSCRCLGYEGSKPCRPQPLPRLRLSGFLFLPPVSCDPAWFLPDCCSTAPLAWARIFFSSSLSEPSSSLQSSSTGMLKSLRYFSLEPPNLRKRPSRSFSSPARTARERTCTSSLSSAFSFTREPIRLSRASIFFLSFAFAFSSSVTRMRSRVSSSSFVMGEVYRILQT